MDELLGWPEIARSPQLAKFLSYIVEAQLRGDETSIKAYSIAVDVFGRPATFDPQADPIVRVQARRLRGLLDQFYGEERGVAGVRIALPVGRYVPEFSPLEIHQPALPPELIPEVEQRLDADFVAAEVQSPPNRTVLRPWLLGALAGVIALTAILLGLQWVIRPDTVAASTPGPPHLTVHEFTAVADPSGRSPDTGGLAVELVTDLQLFGNVDVNYASTQAAAPGEGNQYDFTGVARYENLSPRYSAIIRPSRSDTTLWSHTVASTTAAEPDVDAISQEFAWRLGSPRGPLHAAARAWLSAQTDLSGHETEYVCRLLFSQYRETRSAGDADRARRCSTGLLQRSPDSALGLAIGGALLFDAANRESMVNPDQQKVAEADAMLDRASELAQTDSFVWEQRARVLDGLGRTDEARNAFRSALQLNPANSDALAAFARMLSLHGDWEEGNTLALRALDADPAPPFWYHTAVAVNALRAGNDELAIAHAERLAQVDGELGSVIATAAAARSGNEEVLNRRLPQVLEMPRFRQYGITAVLNRRIPDQALVTSIEQELLRAGISPATLSGPF